MYEVPLKQIPCQELSVTLDDVFYTIRLRYFAPTSNTQGIVFNQVKVGDNAWLASTRCVPNMLLIPYAYQTGGGNFFFYCTDKHYPDYNKFGNEHKLIYLSDIELEEIEAYNEANAEITFSQSEYLKVDTIVDETAA